eukprot:gb/GECH01002387.1/.p1 GENE.gb/GECH01002387.1/~~gb/GECH01002387.1/.p1  ORF type:complete len:315 (+),score=66.08 gb/GECH01002387.1/:1-945(+)
MSEQIPERRFEAAEKHITQFQVDENHTFTIPKRANSSELGVMVKEVEKQHKYDSNPISIPKNQDSTIIDIGATYGIFSLYMASQHPRSTLYAMEPIPLTFECLCRNVENSSFSNRIHTIRAGASEGSSEPQVFHYYPVSPGSSTLHPEDKDFLSNYNRHLQWEVLKRFMWQASRILFFICCILLYPLRFTIFGPQPASYAFKLGLGKRILVRCPMKSISKLIKEKNIKQVDLLKIDVEGGELQVLKGIEKKDWSKIKQIVVETRDFKEWLQNVETLLKNKGFKITKTAVDYGINKDWRIPIDMKTYVINAVRSK